MARKNRIVIEDGLYHVTTRIAHQEHLLADPSVKGKIVNWIYEIAEFSGVNVCAWNVMDNHLHLLVHVPTVPEKFWTASSEAGTACGCVGLAASSRVPVPPQPSAFSMRPSEKRSPRWQPDFDDPTLSISPAAGRPSEEAVSHAITDGVPLVTLPQVPTRFTMSDEEMLERLKHLYSDNPKRVEDIAERWAHLHAAGSYSTVESEKDAYCRRMYNVSQYMKTLKETISRYFNTVLGHQGQLWDGRFYSVLVDQEDDLAKLYVTSYIELNSYRTKKKIPPEKWSWCSYAIAAKGTRAEAARPTQPQAVPPVSGTVPSARMNGWVRKAREGYEKLFKMGWREVVKRLQSVFEARGYETQGVEKGEDGEASETSRPMVAIIRRYCRALERGGFFSRKLDFAKTVMTQLPAKFPALSDRSIRFFARQNWRIAA